MKEKISNIIRIVILSAIFSTAIGYSLADFQAPPCAPPCGNTPPPINVGSATQVRDGVFIINNQFGATVGNFGTALIGKASGLEPIYATDPGDTLVRKDFLDNAITNVKGYVDTKVAGAGDNMGNRDAQGGTINGVATPQVGSDAATKWYVDQRKSIDFGSCRMINTTTITPVEVAYATCNSNEIMLSGGGACSIDGDNFSGTAGDKGFIHYSGPGDTRSWAVNCYQSDMSRDVISKAWGVCCTVI